MKNRSSQAVAEVLCTQHNWQSVLSAGELKDSRGVQLAVFSPLEPRGSSNMAVH